MSSKLAPGRRDFYALALPDEEMFPLLARDPMAPFLVSIWSAVRMGDLEKAHVVFTTMLARAAPRYLEQPDVEAGIEAMDCSAAMFAWAEQNDGRWHDASPAKSAAAGGPPPSHPADDAQGGTNG